MDSTLTEFKEFIVQYNSIDEAMRRLYINGDKPKFQRYKNLIQLIFYFIESTEMYRDNRYTQFLLTLVNNNKKLPASVYLLSWNYDNQIEFAAKEIDQFLNDNTLNERNHFKINTLRAAPYILSNNSDLKDSQRLDIVNEIINEKTETIQFAWEEKDSSLHKYRADTMKEFIQNIKITENDCIVSIGYSFPYINHLVDREFIYHINPKRIYVQNPEIFISESIKERFALPQTQIIPILNCDRFHIPNELYK